MALYSHFALSGIFAAGALSWIVVQVPPATAAGFTETKEACLALGGTPHPQQCAAGRTPGTCFFIAVTGSPTIEKYFCETPDRDAACRTLENNHAAKHDAFYDAFADKCTLKPKVPR